MSSPPAPPYRAGSSATATGFAEDGRPYPGNPSLRPGQRLRVAAGGYRPGARVAITLHSVTRSLGAVTADPSGAVVFDFAVPVDLPAGAHRLQMTGSGHTAMFPFTVRRALAPRPAALPNRTSTVQTDPTSFGPGSAPLSGPTGPRPAAGRSGALPHTGAPLAALVGWAALAVLVGVLLLWRTRPLVAGRRSHARPAGSPGRHRSQ